MSLYVCKRDIPKKARKRWKSFDSHLIDSYSDVLFFLFPLSLFSPSFQYIVFYQIHYGLMFATRNYVHKLLVTFTFYNNGGIQET